MIVVLTGPIGVGKTSVAGRVADLARQRGLACGGLLAPALLDRSGHKAGVWGVSVAAGERRVLARIDCDLGGPQVGPYSFDSEALAWAMSTLDRALRDCDLVIVDEIGPLELRLGQGLAPVVPRLAAGEARRALVLVRESLLGELQGRLEPAGQVVFCVDEGNRDSLSTPVLDRLAGGPAGVRDP